LEVIENTVTGKNNELIRLFNDHNFIIDLITYKKSTQWFLESDGNVPVLFLLILYLDNSISRNRGTSVGYDLPGAVNKLKLN
jgi:hypothetical protein